MAIRCAKETDVASHSRQRLGIELYRGIVLHVPTGTRYIENVSLGNGKLDGKTVHKGAQLFPRLDSEKEVAAIKEMMEAPKEKVAA
jgi:hypothetical protein